MRNSVFMKNKKRRLLIIFITLLAIAVAAIVLFRLLGDKNSLTIKERTYINKARTSLIDVNVLSTNNVFGSNGGGVFYDFLSSFENEYKLSFNKIYLTEAKGSVGLSLTKGPVLPNKAIMFYTDHYVLVSKSFINVYGNDINGLVGVLNEDLASLNKYIKATSFKTYENKETLLKGFETGEVSFIAVPMIEYLDVILDGLYSIVYHISDMKDYYYLSSSNDDTLDSILNKYFNVWGNFTDSFNKSMYSLFTNKLKITEKELDIINSKKYTYGFIENAPYEIKKSGTYGGIIANYIKSFASFSNITFDYKNYHTIDALKKDIAKGNVDLYVDYYGLNNLINIDSLLTITESVVMANDDKRTFTSLASLSSNTVYIKETSTLKSYLESFELKISYFKNEKDINKLIKDKQIVIMDYPEYLIYRRTNDNAGERFRIIANKTYNFKSNNDSMFNRMFTYYISTIDPNNIVYTGIANYDAVVKSGKLIAQITKYAAIIIIVVGAVAYVLYRSSKRVHIKQKIKKADKMKYIDVLTSLKNRNFLTENIPKWNQNTIYPQAIILINLNDIQGLNDTLGYLEGDKQIQSFANILIKTQPDNTEIMRTDGNEFVVYMVGYNEKQVLSYIKKLNKEIKNLPHDRGAAIGFSMIEDDIKLIDDAINEATESMKKNKELLLIESDENVL